MARLLITRHGQTKENADGIMQGKEHGNVSEGGFEQINKLIERLKCEKIDKIISSDIPRCKVTTKEILEKIKVPVKYTPLIREKDNGEWAGKKHKDIKWGDIEGTFETRKAPSGENLLEVRERGRKFFEELTEKFKDKDITILIVAHGAFLKIFIGNLLGMTIQDSISKLCIEHCSLTEIEIDNKYKEGYKFNFINDTSHLK